MSCKGVLSLGEHLRLFSQIIHELVTNLCFTWVARVPLPAVLLGEHSNTQLQLAIPQCNHRVWSVYLPQGPSLNSLSTCRHALTQGAVN